MSGVPVPPKEDILARLERVFDNTAAGKYKAAQIFEIIHDSATAVVEEIDERVPTWFRKLRWEVSSVQLIRGPDSQSPWDDPTAVIVLDQYLADGWILQQIMTTPNARNWVCLYTRPKLK